ncbi:DinB family protein [Luteimicrobium sp. DT211]|uniref:DinB family protein n=1 Tax=Luteimicrobium sp. DT211 TaxID=3393412 RepID=UPI003CE9BD57
MTSKRPALDEPEPFADDRELLLGWLAFHRDALSRSCADLTPEQLVERSVPPSDLSLLGLVRHLTEMEHWYLEGTLGPAPVEPLYCPDDDPDGDILGLDVSMVEPSFARWRAKQDTVDTLLAQQSLDDLTRSRSRTVRWCVVKVVEEYARHNGHADLLRERIDGVVGE